jgi:tRNA-(ms[2]io[6]A)-hydroxylase
MDAPEKFPLSRATAPDWAATALQDLDALLVDHAHCEEKAASSALKFLARHADVKGLWRAMTALAHEELRHFRVVVEKLEARGGTLTPPKRDRYAGELRRLSASLPGGLGGLGDALLAAAFIEARSCERFRCLAAELRTRAGEADLATFYRQLADAEERHWELFRDLAIEATSAERVARRLPQLAEAEGALIASLPHGPRIH